MSVEQRRTGAHFTFSGNYGGEIKNTSLNFNPDSVKSIPEEKNISNSKSYVGTTGTLPINFFHSPGEYNKMIIRCANPHKQNYLQKQMGIVKTLEFINQPFFVQEKQKRIERVKNYQEELAKRRKQQKAKQSQTKLKCVCCCCDNYCEDCAKTTSCDVPQENNQRHIQLFQKQMQAIKKRVLQKQKKREMVNSIQNDSQETQHKNKTTKDHNFQIDMLVNQTLFRQIQSKRQKMLEKLQKQERHKANQIFNETIRKINKQRAQSAKSKVLIQKSPTKREIREAYWQQIKALVAQQIKKDKIQHSKIIEKASQPKQGEKKGKPSAKQIAINRFILKRSQQVLKQIKSEKLKKEKIQKIKAKKLLALAAEQAEIIKKNKAKKFKPSQEMLQNAFKLID